MRWLKAVADKFREHDEFVERTIQQWMPHQTCSRLDEWEKALGLPEQCFGDDQSVQLRRSNMLARLGGDLDLPFDDSSADSIGSIKRYLKRYGFEVDVWYNVPFRVGVNRVGDRLGSLNGVLHVQVLYLCEPFRVGVSRVGDRLVNCTKNTSEVECLLKRIVPARYDINVIYF